MQDLSEFFCGDDYDCEYSHLYEADIALIQRYIDKSGAKRLLDLCCGTGIVTVPLAEKLTFTTGVDIQPQMLATAIRKARHLDNIEFIEADATRFVADEPYDIAVMTGNAFQTFLDDPLLESVLSNLSRQLVSGAYFIFDTRLPIGSNLTLDADWGETGSYTDPQGRHVRRFYKRVRYDEQRNIIYFEKKREYPDGSQFFSSIDLKYRPLETIIAMLDEAGFDVEARFSNWEADPLQPDSKGMVCVARKR
ncbi:class I SAM-dependent methyltransferase [Veronia pacifica]|uniref:Methyltransferase domain-containing protein n=1 Tax=Veronia pacifica TaxID=1080227 RepID=A0A1C3ECF4_9GAMM|nr:class I SAM-dependent methyltransferase [Veronia pacifica]ODA30918.1 hypothetical protein A8L45_18770 [Veronia pacifica]